jgi:hypothetical protein
MNWDALQAIGELIAAAGVIISLSYLAVQVRQNTRSNAAAASQDLLSSYLNLLGHSWQSEYGARVFHTVLAGTWEELSDAEQAAGRQFWVSAMRLFEHAFQQHRAGLLPEEAWQGWQTQIVLSCGLKGFEDTWPANKTLLNQDFVAWVDGLGAQVGPAVNAYQAGLAGRGLRVTTLGVSDEAV